MAALPPSLEQLIEEFSKLPSIGRRSAERLAFHLLNSNHEKAGSLASSITRALENIRFCKICFNVSEDDLCEICKNSNRNKALICVVEDPRDILAFENSGSYNGLYHSLGGCLSPIKGITPDKLNIAPLIRRIDTSNFEEAILATSPSVDGDATALYIQKLIGSKIPKTTRIGFGISVGSNFENVDSVTLQRSLEGRKSI